ncbi:MAG: T9SS type A sorting domain-containing protein, partial [Saprospiraceae bacterium]|nr:T9SS type A sorting domain-containing protein [Saprospiraceae bacterium]
AFRFVILSVFLLYCSGISAQLFTIGPDSVSVTGGADELYLEAHTTLLNTQDTAIQVAWQRTIVTQPDTWINYLCSDFLCFLPENDSGMIYVLPHQEMDVNMTFFPQDVPGIGDVLVTFWDATEAAPGAVTIRYTCTAEATTATKQPATTALNIYPNPARDHLYVQSHEQIAKVSIRSADGRIIQNVRGNFRVPLTGLPHGTYIAHVKFGDGRSAFAPFVKR